MKENDIIEETTPADTPADDASQENGQKLYTQAELDEMLSAEREQLEKKLAEAEKLAAMSESARSDYKRELRDKELAEREAAVAKRELIADACDKLTAAGLPKQLALCLNYEGRDECMESLESVSRAFIDAVTASVNERIRGRSPKFTTTSAADCDPFLDGLRS